MSERERETERDRVSKRERRDRQRDLTFGPRNMHVYRFEVVHNKKTNICANKISFNTHKSTDQPPPNRQQVLNLLLRNASGKSPFGKGSQSPQGMVLTRLC